MILKTSIGLAFASACLTAIVTMPVRADTVRQNVIQSERYDRLLETNRAFRQARMRKSVVRLPIRSSINSAWRVSVRTSLWSHRRHLTEGSPRPGTMQSNM
jgi:hypothetical protein